MNLSDLVVEQWAEGIQCLQLPMPAFGGVNAFIVGAAKRHTVIDTGMPGAETKAVWQAVLRDRPLHDVEAVLCTHAHIDHLGQVGMLVSTTGAPLLMSAEEHEDAVFLTSTSPAKRDILARALLEQGGFGADGAQLMDYSILDPFPEAVLLQDGVEIELGGITFEVIVGGGHSRAPICLLSRERKLLLAGDQVLRASGPQVPVQAERPQDDPLGAYFNFLDRFDALPDDLVVFPGHGGPIHGFKDQLARIRAGHHLRLERLLERLSGAMTCAEMAPLVFPDPSRRLAARLRYLMLAMTNYLVAQSRLRVCTESGTSRYRKE